MARKILLADDSVTAQNMGRKILADAGYEVITVNNGSAALKKISEQRPDVIVLDVYMPGYSGLEVCQRLKEVGETSQIPILLTVGKLEPFKPEEVRRVRADGFIVKPFEASELLSALSKLEDRIVPRSESSKPGRFARALASVDEGRYDKTVAIEEDTGWKNRIRFPEKKKQKEKEPQPEPDEATAYSSGSKDLRTVIEHKLAEIPSNGNEKEKEKDRVDLGALAPVGLPKDVTPEEIAALAAAAAQMQGRVAETKISEPAEPTAITAVEAPRPESRDEVRSEAQSEIPAPATFAEQKPHEQAEAKPAEIVPAASIADSQSHPASPEPAADEPVTMAVGGSTSTHEIVPSRWTAVSVALAPEDAAISLEQEMQKAYAAFAAAETGHAGSGPNMGDSISAPTSSVVPAQPVISESVLPVPASAAPEAAQTLAAVASAATDAMSAAAEQLQAVAASYVEQKESAASVAADTSSASAQAEQRNEPPAVHADAIAADKPKTESEPLPATTILRAEESKDSAHAADGPSQPEVPTEPFAASISPATEIASETAGQPPETSLHKEADIAASTAAAWANAQASQESSGQSSEIAGQELAAKAVAAGAESSPEEAATDPAIASIVDSVLAGLRPKIVEEISRKLGKKS